MNVQTTKPAEAGNRLMRILMLTLTISMMSGIMFNIALPQISEDFGLTLAQVSWLSSAYILIYAIGAVTYGKLADRYPLKTLVTFGLLLFGAGSLIGLASHTFALALIGRCLQSAGAAVIPAVAMLIPIRYFAPERRGSALGLTAVGLALGSALGPVISALIVSFLHWRWLFAVPLLILIALPMYRKHLADEQLREAGKFDWGGGMLLAVTVALLLLSVTNGWTFALGGAAALTLFIARVRTAREPFIEPTLFRNRKYVLGLTVAFLINGIGCSLNVLSPLLLSKVQALPSVWIGFTLVPAAVASAVWGRKGGRLADLKGNAYLWYIATGLAFACHALLSTFAASAAPFIAGILILGTVGQSFLVIALSNAISRVLPQEQTGVGMGMLAMVNFISQGIAIGIYGKMADRSGAAHLSWNPLFGHAKGMIFSNIWLVLAVMQVVSLAVYYYAFGRRRRIEASKHELNMA
ncbi:MFS transporter [Cohnella nanjingensis]|uniref:MFS transporter n=1 Tax=Cohnella nanjingensis TaxID=1387779 RepID=A0A7X0RQA3_9BACL|nr:MFS transporter [Cohnella nanjingensis]MBB6671571.1 MFS transporter [Cohnella nanjingensis]